MGNYCGCGNTTVDSPRESSIDIPKNQECQTSSYEVLENSPINSRLDVSATDGGTNYAATTEQVCRKTPPICHQPMPISSFESYLDSPPEIRTNHLNKVFITTKFTLKNYPPRSEIRVFYKQQFRNLESSTKSEHDLISLINVLKSRNNFTKLTEQNYLDALLLFADIEDVHGEQIQCHNRKNLKISRTNYGEYMINMPNRKEGSPPLTANSRISIRSQKSKSIYGTIMDVQPNRIIVEFKRPINTSVQYDIDFLTDRTSLRLQKLAVELMEEKKLAQFLFPRKTGVQKSDMRLLSMPKFIWFNESVGHNANQQIVIEHIFNGTSYPYPYIVFGPPGTGKTTTLVECILQLWRQKNNSRILVVSTSNYACNVICKRLLQFISNTELFRIFAKSQEAFTDQIDADIVNASNLQNNKHRHPKPAELYQYRIIVATLTTAGRLIPDGFDCTFFTHLFIDECGSCTEGSAIIPIAGLVSTYNMINAHIILAGDPLQLGPVIQSKYAEDMGYGVSMLERLMNFAIYKKNNVTQKYNNNFITKLQLNYRSNKDILHVSNKLFYNSELSAVGSKDVTDWILNWKRLPNRKFPIIFEAVFGQSSRDGSSPRGCYGLSIQVLVNKNVNGKIIRQSDIGVITPYRKQNSKIRDMCDRRNWTELEVASIEAFQGNEKNIIILSTVRSNVETLGFLNNAKRFNVAITRAQGLLIIIGDPSVLARDKCWLELIRFCDANNAICGEEFNLWEFM